MGGTGVRTWLLVGGGLGVLSAVLIILFSGTAVGLLLEALLAVVAGVLTAYLSSRAPVAVAAPAGPIGPAPRNLLVRSGTLAGAAVGVLAGVAFFIVALRVVYSPDFRDQISTVFQQQGLQAGSVDG